MSTFQVPQFIEEKAKIVGPLTLVQFFYIAGAAGISFIAFHIFSFILWFMLTLIVAGIGLGFAFVKINGVSLPNIFLNALNYLWQPRTYTWQKAMAQTTLNISDIEKLKEMRRNISIQEKLKSVVLRVTTGKIFKPKPPSEGERYQIVTYLTGEKKIAKKIDY